MAQEPLIPWDQYLAADVHIGTKQKSAHMAQFIKEVEPNGIYIIDIKHTDFRLKLAIDLLSRYHPENILAVSCRQFGFKPVQMFASCIGAKSIVGRFKPGTLTNPTPDYLNIDIVVVSDPITDSQALNEASICGIPVVALCDTNNIFRNVDLVIPTNNKGRRALALIFWILARGICGKLGIPFQYSQEDFQAEL